LDDEPHRPPAPRVGHGVARRRGGGQPDRGRRGHREGGQGLPRPDARAAGQDPPGLIWNRRETDRGFEAVAAPPPQPPNRQTGRMLHRHPFLSVLTIAYLAFVGWVTLTPGSEAPTRSDLVMRVLARLQGYQHMDWLTFHRAEYLANVALFVPVGLFLLLLFGSRY